VSTPPIPLQAQEAQAAAEADWYEANEILPGAEAQAVMHKLAQDMFAAGVEWAAALASQLGVCYLRIEPFARGSGYMPGYSIQPFAGRLRGELSP
jgi:hypothetical protein